jgi:hypothetical protein
MLQTSIYEMIGSNLGQDAGYLTEGFRGLSPVPQSIYNESASIIPWPIPSNPFQSICHPQSTNYSIIWSYKPCILLVDMTNLEI